MAAPVNDLRVNATPVVITTDGATFTAVPTPNAEATATIVAGLTDDFDSITRKSVWWTYTPLTTGPVTITPSYTGTFTDVSALVYFINTAGEPTGNYQVQTPNSDTRIIAAGQRLDISVMQAYDDTNPHTYGLTVSGPASVPAYVAPDALTYGSGYYGSGYYSGRRVDPPAPVEVFAAPSTIYANATQILGIGPWNPTQKWRGAANLGVPTAYRPARPVMALPPATGLSYTLRLNDGSEARAELTFTPGAAIVIEEMSTDLWWRRRNPHTGNPEVEMIGRFNTSHVDMSKGDTGIAASIQFEDYRTVLSERLVLRYKDAANGESMWSTYKAPTPLIPAVPAVPASPGPPPVAEIPAVPAKPATPGTPNTPVTEILKWAVPTNTGIDISVLDDVDLLGNITANFTLPPGSTLGDVFDNLLAISPKPWEWWVETPNDINAYPKLQFVVGTRGQDRGVVLYDYGGPTPIAGWSMKAAADSYANAIYFTASDGGVVDVIAAQITEFGQRDIQDGSSSVSGDDMGIALKRAAAKRLAELADRRPTFTIALKQGFWRGRFHIDVGDLIRLRIKLGKELIAYDYRVSEITVDIDDTGSEAVSLTLGTPLASANPRSKRSPLIRLLRKLKNYNAPPGSPPW